MGGSSVYAIEEDWELTSPYLTVVLVGRTGNGKSATGNSILGRKAFKSRASSSGVTSTCELETTVSKDGQIINVVDTPGLFDFSDESELIGKEIVKCINMAKDGIHAIIVVFSVRTRFSQEEEAAIRSLQNFFGEKIIDYMIVVFTGGDELDDNDETMEDYLGRECPKPLMDILSLCENRYVLFDNKTKDESKKADQLKTLFSLISSVMSKNGGRPYTDEIFAELQKGAMKLQQIEFDFTSGDSKRHMKELQEEIKNSYEQHFSRITEMVEAKLKETTTRLEQQLAEEQAARLKAEEKAQIANMKAHDEISQLRKSLEEAQRETDELRKRAENAAAKCTIL